MPDAIFTHPRLAAVYDVFDGERDDLDAYLGIADALNAHRVLDVGCGTGSLAILLAESGRTVVGVDPAEASLEVARAKAGSAAVTWLHGDATTAPALGFDLAVMTGNVAQVFLTDDDWTATLRGVHAALHPRGHLVFETRRPEYRAWEEWADGAVVTSDSTLRFRDRDEIETSLTTAGYRVLDVRDAPDRPGCEFVFVTRRTT